MSFGLPHNDSLHERVATAADQAAPLHPKYRPDIDGLRAVAVLMVVGFHAFPARFAGGFVGVDVFFVISGFLISTILFENLRAGRFSFAVFYMRRVKRIFPALIVVLLACLAFGWLVLLRDEYRALGKHVSGGAGFVSNLLLWQESGYFDRSADAKPLLHLWSLGIEEQFYLVWPLILWAAWRWRLHVLGVTLTIAAVSFGLNIFFTGQDAVAAFYSPPTRFWELLVGACIAWWLLPRPDSGTDAPARPMRRAGLLSVLGAALLVAAFVLTTRDRAFPGWWALLPVGGAALLIAAGPGAWLNRHLLANRLMVWVGLISFPLYLWHWPLLAYSRIVAGGEPPSRVRALAVLAAFVLAWLTWRFVEQPIRSGRIRRPVAALGGAMAGTFALGLAVFMAIALPRNLNPELQPILAAVADWDYPGSLRATRFGRQTFYRAGDEEPVTFMVGDSHVEQYGPRLAALARHQDADAHSVVFGTSGGCPFMPRVFEDDRVHQGCEAFRAAAMAYIARPEVKTVVVGGCWNCYFVAETAPKKPGEPAYDYYHLAADGRRENFRGGQGRTRAIDELRQHLKTISQISPGKKVYLLLDNPMGEAFDPKNYLTGNRITGVQVREAVARTARPNPAEIALNAELAAMAAGIGIEVIDPIAALCRGGACDVLTDDGQFVYRDNHHLRPFYVEARADYLDKVLVERR
jgi:peptidoglycan/LPS O-acetylase OafA/YrhL